MKTRTPLLILTTVIALSIGVWRLRDRSQNIPVAERPPKELPDTAKGAPTALSLPDTEPPPDEEIKLEIPRAETEEKPDPEMEREMDFPKEHVAEESSMSVHAITDPDNPRRKWQIVYELTGELSQPEAFMLAAYLTDNPIGEAEFHGEEFGHRNFIMDALREQTDDRPLVVATLVRVYEELRQGDVMRGYALQHLTSLYIDPTGTPPAAERSRIVATLHDALTHRQDGTLAATGLIGLHEVSLVDPSAVSAATVDLKALELLNDPLSGDLTRISALHVAGERNLSAAVPVARRFAADPEQDWVVRMASVWLLGEDGSDPALLAQLTEDHDENVRRAARMARKNKGDME